MLQKTCVIEASEWTVIIKTSKHTKSPHSFLTLFQEAMTLRERLEKAAWFYRIQKEVNSKKPYTYPDHFLFCSSITDLWLGDVEMEKLLCGIHHKKGPCITIFTQSISFPSFVCSSPLTQLKNSKHETPVITATSVPSSQHSTFFTFQHGNASVSGTAVRQCQGHHCLHGWWGGQLWGYTSLLAVILRGRAASSLISHHCTQKKSQQGCQMVTGK